MSLIGPALALEVDWTKWWLMGYGSGNVSMGLEDATATGHALQLDDRLPWTALYAPPVSSFPTSLLNDTSAPLALSFMPEPDAWDWDEQKQAWQTNLSAGAGSHGEADASLLAGGALGDSPWRLGIAAQHMQIDGETTNLNNGQDDWAQRTMQFVRVKSAYVRDPWAVSLEVTDMHSRWGDDSIFLSALDNRYSFSDTPGYDKQSEQGSRLQLLTRLGAALTLRWETRYLDREREQLQDIDRINQPLEAFGYIAQTQRWRHEGQLYYLWENGSETRLQAVYLEDETQDASINTGLLLRPLSSQVVTLAFLADQTTRQRWIEVAHDWPVDDTWAMMASVRQARDEYNRRELDVASAPGLLPGNQLQRSGLSSQSFNSTLGHVQVRHPYSDEASWSFDLENTYAPGGVSFNLVSGERRPFAEETGLRAALTWQWDSDLGFSTSEFWMQRVDNKQVPLFARRDNPFDVGIVNIPTSREMGLRLSGQRDFDQAWSATWVVEWRDTRFTEAPSDLLAIENNRWLYTPELDATLGLRRSLGESWQVAVEVRRQTGQFTDVQNTEENLLPAWTMINGHVQYRNQPWLVTLWGANLSDENIFNYRSPADNFGVLTIGRTLGLRIEWQP